MQAITRMADGSEGVNVYVSDLEMARSGRGARSCPGSPRRGPDRRRPKQWGRVRPAARSAATAATTGAHLTPFPAPATAPRPNPIHIQSSITTTITITMNFKFLLVLFMVLVASVAARPGGEHPRKPPALHVSCSAKIPATCIDVVLCPGVGGGHATSDSSEGTRVGDACAGIPRDTSDPFLTLPPLPPLTAAALGAAGVPRAGGLRGPRPASAPGLGPRPARVGGPRTGPGGRPGRGRG